MKTVIATLLFILTCPARADSASLCVAKVPTHTAGERSLANPTASKVPFEFTVSVDGATPIPTSHQASVLIPGLDPTVRHRVSISQNGKPKASFSFRFSDHGSNAVCLWYGPLYDSWSVWPMSRSRGKCSCKDGKS
jgi:hypothetical protein